MQPQELEMIEKLSRAISNDLCGMNVPLNKRPWSAEQCADYLGMTTKTFQNSIAPLSVFPRAIRAATATGRGHPHWCTRVRSKIRRDHGFSQ